MYNRYIRNDNGSYTRIPEEEPSGGARRPDGPPPGGPEPAGAPPGGAAVGGPPPGGPQPGGASSGGTASSGGPQPSGPGPGRQSHGPPHGGRPADGLTGILQHLLDQFHLDHVDTGDLLLLALLFFLFRENADEELLVALGLLLIL
ncbi:hypothetical protein [uncultured Oscillibacter sp.]|uniref:hypothetical protein n=1 Tax=uncultured Oscillibacter sp. TaxID=876091 RepID=UPI00262C0C08|nr:hypothetical protein [uncultured Oscillibacter sp.]